VEEDMLRSLQEEMRIMEHEKGEWRRTLVLRPVQRNKLNSQQIITRRYTSWHIEVMPPLVGDHGVYSPFPVAESVVRYFEPLEACCTCRSGIVDLGEIV
jgi:hypothetical protein